MKVSLCRPGILEGQNRRIAYFSSHVLVVHLVLVFASHMLLCLAFCSYLGGALNGSVCQCACESPLLVVGRRR